MKTFEFNESGAELLRLALQKWMDELVLWTAKNRESQLYVDLDILKMQLTPKKVTKTGWIVVSPSNKGAVGVYETEEQAKQIAQYRYKTEAQVIRIEWEQEV